MANNRPGTFTKAGKAIPRDIKSLVAEAERELKMRQRAFPNWVAAGRMKQHDADVRIGQQIAIVNVLVALRDYGNAEKLGVEPPQQAELL